MIEKSIDGGEMGRIVDIDVARERDDDRLIDEWHGDKPKPPLVRKVDPDDEHDREREE